MGDPFIWTTTVDNLLRVEASSGTLASSSRLLLFLLDGDPVASSISLVDALVPLKAVWPFGRFAFRPFGSLAVWPFGRLVVWPCGKGSDDCHGVAFSSQCRLLESALQGCASLAETPQTNVVVESPVGSQKTVSSTTFVVELPAGTQKSRLSGADTRTARSKTKGTEPRTSLLNFKRQKACLLLWVAGFPSPSGPGPGLCSCVVCGSSLGAFALFLVLCASWATTREPFLSSGFDDEDAVLNRYLSTPVYVICVRLHTGWFLSGFFITGSPWCRSSCVCCVFVYREASRRYTSRPSTLSSTSLLLHFRSSCFR